MGWRKDLNSKPGERTSGPSKSDRELAGMASAGRGVAGREIACDGVEESTPWAAQRARNRPSGDARSEFHVPDSTMRPWSRT